LREKHDAVFDNGVIEKWQSVDCKFRDFDMLLSSKKFSQFLRSWSQCAVYQWLSTFFWSLENFLYYSRNMDKIGGWVEDNYKIDFLRNI